MWSNSRSISQLHKNQKYYTNCNTTIFSTHTAVLVFSTDMIPTDYRVTAIICLLILIFYCTLQSLDHLSSIIFLVSYWMFRDSFGLAFIMFALSACNLSCGLVLGICGLGLALGMGNTVPVTYLPVLY